MAEFNHKQFIKDQIEWYKKEIEWYTKDIEWESRQITKLRAEEKELAEHVWSRGVLTQIEMEIWGSGKHIGSELKKALANRKRDYLKRKKCAEQLAKYEAQLAGMEA